MSINTQKKSYDVKLYCVWKMLIFSEHLVNSKKFQYSHKKKKTAKDWFSIKTPVIQVILKNTWEIFTFNT